MSPIVRFYRDGGLDAEGRSLQDLWNFTDEEMEFHHDFIQWMFPLKEPSQFNWKAPTLTEDDTQAFWNDSLMRRNLMCSLARFLAFLGLMRTEAGVEPAPDFEAKKDVFLTPNHNWLRITRALTSLRLLGLSQESKEFYEGLDSLIKKGRARISSDTRRYWQHAVSPEAKS